MYESKYPVFFNLADYYFIWAGEIFILGWNIFFIWTDLKSFTWAEIKNITFSNGLQNREIEQKI